MSFVEGGKFVGALLIVSVLILIVTWTAKRARFFRLPPRSEVYPISFSQTLGVFLIYVAFAFLLLPAISFLIGYWVTGYWQGLELLTTFTKGWISFASLTFLFCCLLGYCFLIRKGSRRALFWGEGEGTFPRFCKSLGMGLVALLVAYPFLFITSLIASAVAESIWGDVQVEQVAVKQLKMTMGHPSLFTVMVLAVIFIVPFMEELLFRGFLQSYLKRYIGRIGSLFASAFIFALVHYAPSQGVGNFQLIICLFTLSCFIGFIYERERTLWAPVAMHAAFNAFSILYIVLSTSL